MRGQKAFRRLHYWGATIAALPVLVIVSTGLLLQVKKQVTWIQPKEFSGAAGDPQVTFAQALDAARSVPAAGVSGWADVPRIEVRPRKNVLKLISESGYEVQVDLVSGAVLHAAPRRSDLIETIHDGSFFHDAAKLWLFLPAGIVLFGMWVTGIYLIAVVIVAKRRRRTRLQELGSA